MKLSVILAAGLLASSVSPVLAQDSFSVREAQVKEITPGTVIVRGTPFGFAVREVVLAVEGDRALVRSNMSQGYEWSDLKSIQAPYSSATTVSPTASPYASVLAPVKLTGSDKIIEYRLESVTNMMVDRLGRQALITESGRLLGIGNHVNRDYTAVEGYSTHLQENIPVAPGESPREAIARHNEAFASMKGFNPVDTNSRIDRSMPKFDILAAREHATQHGIRLNNRLEANRAERAMETQARAGTEKAVVEKAVTKAHKAK